MYSCLLYALLAIQYYSRQATACRVTRTIPAEHHPDRWNSPKKGSSLPTTIHLAVISSALSAPHWARNGAHGRRAYALRNSFTGTVTAALIHDILAVCSVACMHLIHVKLIIQFANKAPPPPPPPGIDPQHVGQYVTDDIIDEVLTTGARRTHGLTPQLASVQLTDDL